jgi:2-oxoglutarate dehydrogenase E2 component (dihydrolipoamide succinyltransferase)
LNPLASTMQMATMGTTIAQQMASLALPGATPENPLAIGTSGGPPVVTLPLTPYRQVSMKNLEMMRSTTVPVTVVSEVDCSRLRSLYDSTKRGFEAQTGIPLTFTPFFLRATVKALQAYPLMNAMLTPSGYMVPRQINIGLATSLPGAVLIPTIARAETKSIPDLARDVHIAGTKARSMQLTPQEMADATFVVTNTGSFGSTLFGTPTIKPPNVGILAFEAIRKRPIVVEGDRIEARPMMFLALTADHRAVDGAEMTGFIGKVKECLETISF